MVMCNKYDKDFKRCLECRPHGVEHEPINDCDKNQVKCTRDLLSDYGIDTMCMPKDPGIK